MQRVMGEGQGEGAVPTSEAISGTIQAKGFLARPATICAVLAALVWAVPDCRSLEAGAGSVRKDAALAGADLRGADLQGANFQHASLQEAQLQGANLQGAHLQGADLQGANLEKAQLQGASLQGANLQEANFEGADLRETFFWQANLQGAQLQGVDLSGAIGLRPQQIESAVIDEKTRLPDYLRPPGRGRSTAR